jgi:hypothetical protein
MYEASLDSFTPSFERLLAQYTKEYEHYHIDEIVVAAIAPIVCHVHCHPPPRHLQMRSSVACSAAGIH